MHSILHVFFYASLPTINTLLPSNLNLPELLSLYTSFNGAILTLLDVDEAQQAVPPHSQFFTFSGFFDEVMGGAGFCGGLTGASWGVHLAS